MSRQISPPREERNSDGRRIMVVPREYCDDCGAERTYPHRVYQVGTRELCADCFAAPRLAPSLLYFRPHPPGIY